MKRFFDCLMLSGVFLFALVSISVAQETSIVGKWKTIDDETNEPKTIVQIYERDGKYYGKIIELFRK